MVFTPIFTELSPSMGLILTVAVVAYVVGTAIFIILDNRTPQSTFAWILTFVLMPVIGPIIYLFFGRSWRAFARSGSLASQAVAGDANQMLRQIYTNQDDLVNRIARERPESFNRKLAHLVVANRGSLITEYNHVEILQDATEKYPRLLADIRAAQHSIHLEYYIWTNDAFTQAVKDALIERARAGVVVRCLYDATSGKAMGKQYRADLRAAGVEIYPYLDSTLRTLHNIQYRSHRKIAVIDGMTGYVGGMNLDREQLEGPKGFDGWRDTHLRIHGEAALALQSSFAVSWYNTTQTPISDLDYFPRRRILFDVDVFCPVQIVQSGPDSQWAAIQQLYFSMIMSATSHVYIQSPFFIPDPSVSEALKAAALAGVDVRIMCQPRGGTYQIPYRAANTYYAEMARAGAKIYLYENDTYFHPKTINIDSKICSVGTANMDIRSFNINYEINAVLYDKVLAQQLADDFTRDMANCVEFTYDEYKQRGLPSRLRDSVYRLASPVL